MGSAITACFFYSLCMTDDDDGDDGDKEENTTPVTLGFGIPAPPPSYKHALSSPEGSLTVKKSTRLGEH